jgi:hypothetical protein
VRAAVATVAWCGVGAAYSPVSGVTQHIDAAECEANARLIAASPELLATLEKCIAALEAMDRCYATRLTREDGEVLLEACVVVAKAKGE